MVLVFWKMFCMAEILSLSWMLKTWNWSGQGQRSQAARPHLSHTSSLTTLSVSIHLSVIPAGGPSFLLQQPRLTQRIPDTGMTPKEAPLMLAEGSFPAHP